MRLLCGLFLLLVGSVPLLPLLAGEEEDALRAEVQRLRKDNPELYERRRQELAWVLALPAERREALVKLHRALQSLRPAHRVHYLAVGQRYLDWLAQLPASARQHMEQTIDAQERLKLIRTLREQHWLGRQPLATQKRLDHLKGVARAEELDRLQRAEKWWQRQWQVCLLHWADLKHDEREPRNPQLLPTRLEDFPQDKGKKHPVALYVTEYLWPMLLPQEKEQLERAQGHWPLYPCTLVDLADRHPPALPGPVGPRHLSELPKDVRERLTRAKALNKLGLKKFDGKWPEFAIVITQIVKQQVLALPNELWPIRLEDLSVPMREFVQHTLKTNLNQEELLQLTQAEGSWPEYPRTIETLARKLFLHPPWQTLPGRPGLWDAYRAKR